MYSLLCLDLGVFAVIKVFDRFLSEQKDAHIHGTAISTSVLLRTPPYSMLQDYATLLSLSTSKLRSALSGMSEGERSFLMIGLQPTFIHRRSRLYTTRQWMGRRGGLRSNCILAIRPAGPETPPNSNLGLRMDTKKCYRIEIRSRIQTSY